MSAKGRLNVIWIKTRMILRIEYFLIGHFFFFFSFFFFFEGEGGRICHYFIDAMMKVREWWSHFSACVLWVLAIHSDNKGHNLRGGLA